MILRIILFLSLVSFARCSRVVDKYIQRSVDLFVYCPKIGLCKEGTHVMCLYYNPHRIMGPTCADAVNVTITSDYAQLILDLVNRIRSRITRGKIKGGNGYDLPKGYGMYRLEWDEELATFAQVTANQCVMKNDLCRASKKFPDVGQTIGMIRFTIPDWALISTLDNMGSTTVTPEKVRYAITTIIKAWYDMKKDIDIDVIRDIGSRPPKLLRNQFLYLVYNKVTHIGCGISGFREYSMNTINAALNYNAILLVCNYSSRLHSTSLIYNTVPPSKPGYTVRCGCPLGYDEDELCLCYETGRRPPYSCKDSSRCKPSVVVLPIFTVEDAPLALDYQQSGRNNDTSILRSNEIFEDMKNVESFNERRVFDDYSASFNNPKILDHRIDVPNKRYPVDVKSRNFDRKTKSQKVSHYIETPNRVANFEQNRRSRHSVFSKAPIFELSLRKTHRLGTQRSVYKKDVVPRKDFSKVSELVSKYLDKRKKDNLLDMDEFEKYNHHDPVSLHNNKTNDFQELNRKKNIQHDSKKIGLDDDFNLTNNLLKFDDGKSFNEEADRKLMILLDKLEQEVKEIELSTNEKQIFDNKIRKIYGTLVGKPDLEQISKWKNNSKTNKINYDSMLEGNQLYRNNYYNSLKSKDYDYGDTKRRSDRYQNRLKNKLSTNNEYNDFTDNALFNTFDDYEERGMRNIYNVRKKGIGFHSDDYYLRNEYGGVDTDRRGYYDSKIKALQDKFNLMKRNGYHNNVSGHGTTDLNDSEVREARKLRPVRPTNSGEIKKRRRPKESMNTFYMPDRARFLHGF